MRRARTWAFPFELAQGIAGDELVELGDELGLLWRGELTKPELAPRGHGRRAIVVAVDGDVTPPAAVRVALIEEGNVRKPRPRTESGVDAG